MKSKFRYNHETKEWDYIIKNFMGILGLTLVVKPHENWYPVIKKSEIKE